MPVTLAGVGHRFGEGPWLFREVGLELHPGRVYALTGPSGSGKSTMLALLAGWLEPAEGHLTRPPSGRTTWVFQNPHGVPRRTALHHVAMPFLARELSVEQADAEAAALLDRFGLSALADRPFHQLSGGEAQRLMLARAVATSPGLLLVDEPTAQLDVATAATVTQVIGQLAADGTIVVVATHDPATRDACTDHVDLGRAPRPGSARSGVTTRRAQSAGGGA